MDRARSYWRALLAGEGGLWSFAALLTAFLFCFHVDRWLVLSMEARIGAWAVLGVIFSVCTILLVLRPLLQPLPAEQVAVVVERRYPQLRERLLAAVEFANARPEQIRGVSQALLEDLKAEAEREAGPLNFLKAFKLRGLARSGLTLGLAVLLLGFHLLLAGPAFARFLSRMAGSNLPVWRDTRVQVDPLRTKILKGTDFVVGIDQEGKQMRQARLHFRFGGGRWNTVDLKADKSNGFSHRFTAIHEPLIYYATAGDGRSDQGEARVVAPAMIVGAKLTLQYPAYMGLPTATFPAASGGVAAPLGTRVSMVLQANKPLQLATATMPKAKPVNWVVNGSTVAGSLVVQGNGQYALRLKDQDGFPAPEPQSFPIKAIVDEVPEVRLLDPAGDLDVVPDARVRLLISAKDDHGVAEVRVPYLVQGRKPQTLPAGRGGKREKALELENRWSLSALRLKPGDTVRYRIEATDFDTISGPHVGKTSELQLRIIDRGEAERRYEEQRNEIRKQLAELIKEQKAARADVEAARAKTSPEAIAAAEERQRGVASTAADLARRMGEMNRMAETNNLAQKPELDAQRGTQAGLDKLSQEAMPQAANKIGGAQTQAQASPQAARSQLGEASQQQAEIINALNRLVDQMQPGSELKRLADRFDRLAREQRNLQAQTDRMLPETLGKPMSELTQAQRDALQRSSQAQQSLQRATAQALHDLEKASRSMQDQNSGQAEAAAETAQGLRQSGVTEQQSGASQNTQQNALGQARSQQESAAQELEQAAQQLRQAMNPNDPQAHQRQLRQAMNELNRLMQQQQQAIQQTKGSMTPEQRRE
ncbi:MAG TPA: DUF4175 family protein, partial [Armatimonadota bacterium]|nr:DUF4175 family protein [Armatimonadota bacterium]